MNPKIYFDGMSPLSYKVCFELVSLCESVTCSLSEDSCLLQSGDHRLFFSGELCMRVFRGSGDESLGSKGRPDSWVKDRMMAGGGKDEWIQEVVDIKVDGKYDKSKMETLIMVALRCSDEDKDARPTMSQVVDMLLHLEEDSD